MFSVVTIAREYGSGGAEVGRRVAEMLGWKLLDRQIIERVAAMGKIDRAWAEQADEQCCAWWERVLNGFRHGGPEVYVGGVADTGVDRDSLQQFTAHVIEEAGKSMPLRDCWEMLAMCVAQRTAGAARAGVRAAGGKVGAHEASPPARA